MKRLPERTEHAEVGSSPHLNVGEKKYKRN